MPDSISISFRDQTTGRINDLLMDEHEPCAQTQNLLNYLAGALLNYKDEGVEFTPAVILCDKLSLFLQTFPGSVFHTIGRVPLDPTSGQAILKDCAPLTSSNWFIFIERTEDGFVNYGVFTYFRLPTAIPLHEGITLNPDQFCILVRKTSANMIEMRGAKGSNLSLIFSTVRESVNTSKPIEIFATACCSDVAESGFSQYLNRLLDTALSSSHGTILICAKDLDLSAIPELQDAVAVNPMLDFYAAFDAFQRENSAESILTLQRCEELLHGFLRCDGLIAFDTSGRVTAYRVFYRPSGAAGEPGNKVVGGARRRAFEGLKGLVGKKIVAILFRSQDGSTLHHGVEQ